MCATIDQVIKLPYLDSQYSMVVVKPKRGHNLEDVVRGLRWLDAAPMVDCNVRLYMPRFEFNNTLLFTDVLKKLGLEDLFETEDSLPRISDLPTHIDRIKQQCVIQVEEEGTEAAAVTMTEIHTGCLPPKSPQTRKTMGIGNLALGYAAVEPKPDKPRNPSVLLDGGEGFATLPFLHNHDADLNFIFLLTRTLSFGY